MKFQYNDGGRAATGYKGEAGDCVTRAVAIATDLAYTTVYDDLAVLCRRERLSTKSRVSSARNGVHTKRKWFKDYMTKLGWVWVPTMQIGSGCKVHLRAEELPFGRIIARVSKHYVAVIDGVINDIYDPSRDGTRCVYGYWKGGVK